MTAPKKGSPELERQREMHGWAFRGYNKEQTEAVRHYLSTGEKTEHFPERDDGER